MVLSIPVDNSPLGKEIKRVSIHNYILIDIDHQILGEF